MSEKSEVYHTPSLVFPKAKVRHILFEGTNTGYGMTIYSVLDPEHRSVTYSYSVFNPRDKQFRKSIGRSVALSHYLQGNRRVVCLTNLSKSMFSSKSILFLIMWDILSHVKEQNRTNLDKKVSKRLLRDLRDYVFVLFVNLDIFTKTFE